MNRFLKFVPLAGLAGVLTGCATSPVVEPTTSPSTLPEPTIPINAPAGIPVGQSGDNKLLLASALRAGMRSGRPRLDPFSLRSDERQYETRQESERVFETTGQFGDTYFKPKDDTQAPAPVIEPQPYRRLAGIVVGDSVLALIDMGNGTTELVRPGQKIPGTDWTVVSIDEEKAVLRRGGNVLPHQITVRLELPPPGMGGGGPAGQPGGGFPGAGRPGGFPGGGPAGSGPAGTGPGGGGGASDTNG